MDPSPHQTSLRGTLVSRAALKPRSVSPACVFFPLRGCLPPPTLRRVPCLGAGLPSSPDRSLDESRLAPLPLLVDSVMVPRSDAPLCVCLSVLGKVTAHAAADRTRLLRWACSPLGRTHAGAPPRVGRGG